MQRICIDGQPCDIGKEFHGCRQNKNWPPECVKEYTAQYYDISDWLAYWQNKAINCVDNSRSDSK